MLGSRGQFDQGPAFAFPSPAPVLRPQRHSHEALDPFELFLHTPSLKSGERPFFWVRLVHRVTLALIGGFGPRVQMSWHLSCSPFLPLEV